MKRDRQTALAYLCPAFRNAPSKI